MKRVKNGHSQWIPNHLSFPTPTKSWLNKNSIKHKIVSPGDLKSASVVSADTFREMRRDDPRSYGSERKLFALDLAIVEPPSVPAHFILPPFHSRSVRKKRRSIIDESLSDAKLANLPDRLTRLDKKTKELQAAKKQTIENRLKRKRQQTEKKLEQERVKRQKIELESKFQTITAALKAKTYTKRSVPTLEQIQRFLKKEKGVETSVLNTITLDNICEKWDTF